MTNIVEIDGVSREFGAVKAVSDLTLSLCKGEIMGFLGTNGAGKTTTIKMLLGLIRPTSATCDPARAWPVFRNPQGRRGTPTQSCVFGFE